MEDVDGKEDVEVACLEGVLDGALGALGDEHGFCGEGVVLSSCLRMIVLEVNMHVIYKDENMFRKGINLNLKGFIPKSV